MERMENGLPVVVLERLLLSEDKSHNSSTSATKVVQPEIEPLPAIDLDLIKIEDCELTENSYSLFTQQCENNVAVVEIKCEDIEEAFTTANCSIKDEVIEKCSTSQSKEADQEVLNPIASGESPGRLYVVEDVFPNKKSEKSSNVDFSTVKRQKVVEKQEKTRDGMAECNNCGYLNKIFQSSKNCRKCGAKMVNNSPKIVSKDSCNSKLSENVGNSSYIHSYLQFVKDHQSETELLKNNLVLVPVLNRLPQEIILQNLKKIDFAKTKSKTYSKKSQLASDNARKSQDIVSTEHSIVDIESTKKKVESKKRQFKKIDVKKPAKLLQAKKIERNINRLQQQPDFSKVSTGRVRKHQNYRALHGIISKKNVKSLMKTKDTSKLMTNIKPNASDFRTKTRKESELVNNKQSNIIDNEKSVENKKQDSPLIEDGEIRMAELKKNILEDKCKPSQIAIKNLNIKKFQADLPNIRRKTVGRPPKFRNVDKESGMQTIKDKSKNKYKQSQIVIKNLLNIEKCKADAPNIKRKTIGRPPNVRNIRSTFKKKSIKRKTKSSKETKKEIGEKIEKKAIICQQNNEKPSQSINKRNEQIVKTEEALKNMKAPDRNESQVVENTPSKEYISDVSQSNVCERNTKSSNSNAKNRCYFCGYIAQDKKSLIKHIVGECQQFTQSDLITCSECETADTIKSNCENCASICRTRGCTFMTWFKKVMFLHKKRGRHTICNNINTRNDLKTTPKHSNNLKCNFKNDHRRALKQKFTKKLAVKIIPKPKEAKRNSREDPQPEKRGRENLDRQKETEQPSNTEVNGKNNKVETERARFKTSREDLYVQEEQGSITEIDGMNNKVDSLEIIQTLERSENSIEIVFEDEQNTKDEKLKIDNRSTLITDLQG